MNKKVQKNTTQRGVLLKVVRVDCNIHCGARIHAHSTRWGVSYTPEDNVLGDSEATNVVHGMVHETLDWQQLLYEQIPC
jgi:hypothetical protein